MSKGITIFRDKNPKEYRSNSPSREELITLSRDDYREVLTEAYKEGLKDALERNEKKESTKGSKEEDAKEEGKDEAIKLNEKEHEQNKQRLKVISERQDIEMLRAQSVFPFTLFPDTLIIDTTKISVSKKQLFATEYIATIPLKDLSDVNVQTVLFMGSLTLKYMPQSNSPGMNEPVEIRIPNLRRQDAIRAKNILKGTLVAKAEEIDIAKLSPEEIKDVVEKFGESEGVI